MKLVVFAQTPPPLHGQSYMTDLLLNGLAANDYDIQVFHVNAQFAESSHDIGKFRVGKIFRLIAYCVKALWLRLRHNAPSLYYIPAPPVRIPLYRDWIILLLLRPFFRHTIFHWHAAGLGEWIEKQPKLVRRISHLALDGAHLSISLGRFNETDAAVFKPRRAAIVPNGIPDPCPNFPEIQSLRRERVNARASAMETPGAVEKNGRIQTSVLFLSLCSREKGVFDAIEGVCQANRICRSNHLPLEFTLTIAGAFPDAESEHFFRQTLERLGNPPTIRHVGFATAENKPQLFAEADIFCFPTFYYGESFGLVIVEAMAYGLPVLTTRWRSIPDLFPPNYPGLVDIQSPDQIASALFDLATRDETEEFRNRFLQNYTYEKFLENIIAAIKSIDAN